jgi:hypothetical protein
MSKQIFLSLLFLTLTLAYETISSCQFAINGALIVDQTKFYDYGFFDGRFTTNSASGISVAFGIYDFETEMLGENGAFV